MANIAELREMESQLKDPEAKALLQKAIKFYESW